MKKQQMHRVEEEQIQEDVNPLELLKHDHEAVKELFEEFEETEDEGRKEEIVQEAMQELVIHTTIEEEIFYPKVREYFEGEEEELELMDEAKEEHHVVDLLIEELKEMSPEDDGYFAKFTVLSENVKHHIEEEEGELFPKLKGALKEELAGAGRELLERKEELKTSGAEEKPAQKQKTAKSKRSENRKGVSGKKKP